MLDQVQKLYNQGIVCFNQKRFADAHQDFEKALKILPNDSQLLAVMAIILANMNEFEKAKDTYEKAIKNSKGEPPLNLLDEYGYLLRHMGYVEQSAKIYDKIVRRDPSFVKGWKFLGEYYSANFEPIKGLECWNTINRLSPDDFAALRGLSKCYHTLCLWEDAEKVDNKLIKITKSAIRSNQRGPLDLHTAFLFEKDAHFIKKIAINLSSELKEYYRNEDVVVNKVRKQKTYNRVRVGYLSGALSRHATAYLLQDYFGNHDKEQFEVFIYASGIKGPCKTLDKIQADVEHFKDVSKLTDPDIAKIIRGDDLDILIDLDGVIAQSRCGVTYLKPAPVQLTWLGTPSTLGASWIDYILTDNVVSPRENEEYFTEQILRMPDSYFFNSFSSLEIDQSSKGEWGLPKDKFVFASFNVNRKIDRESFLAWCRILNRVENSVLWMLIDHEETLKNLTNVMVENNVDPTRLIPTYRVDTGKHISRLHNADLMLDCFICGAHTTAVEALWCGLPLVTKIGETFHSRVAASILSAARMESLITHTTEDFIDRAVEIAQNPDTLAGLKKHLTDNKHKLPLFDQKKWMKNFENILNTIVKQEEK